MSFSLGRRLLSGSWSGSRSLANANRRISSDSVSKIIQNNTDSSHSSPWLMLAPKFKDGNIDYNFYSFAESRVLTLPQIQIKGGLSDFMPKPINDLRFRGSSHGWLALFNPHTFQLFLYDPISLRHINLPPMSGIGRVTKVTLSSSPDEPNCHAVMIYGLDDELAFCFPGRSKEWTPLTTAANNSYKDFVYSLRQNLFYGLNKSYHLETWDLTRSTHHPRMIMTTKADDGKYRVDEGTGLVSTGKVEYLVVADDFFSHDRVLLVTRYLRDQEILNDDMLIS